MYCAELLWPASSVELRRLALGLRLLAGQRHAAGADLELHRGRADADQARAAVLDALGVAAVAGDAAGVEERLALWRGARTAARCPRLDAPGANAV